MKILKSIILAITFGFTALVRYKESHAMPLPIEYNYHEIHHGHIMHELLNNRAVILTGDHGQRITIGNERIAKRCRSQAIPPYRLHLHHILFKAMRNTFSGIPYLCMQTPRTHHRLYHDDRQNTDINYSNFSNMISYLNRLRASIVHISNSKNDQYSGICINAVFLITEAQQHWIEQRYSWLYNVHNGRVLLLAQRLLAKDCFPNQIIANKHICQQTKNYIISELNLSHYAFSRISPTSPARHLKKALKGRFQMLSTYTTAEDNIPNINSPNSISSEQANSLANTRYGDSERFYNPISHMNDVSGESSDASSLND